MDMERRETTATGSPVRVAVLGAGYVGLAAAAAAAATGAGVWAVSRRAARVPDGVTPVVADLTAGPPPGVPAELDAVVLTAAPGGGDTYAGTYPPVARAAVALARATGARSLVYTSSTGVYGGRDGAWVDESSPRAGSGPGHAALCEAEDLILGAGLSGVTVLRVAGIYGPGRDPRPRYAEPGRLPLRGGCWVNLAHREDIVAAILGGLDHRGAPRLLNVSDGAPATAAEVARWCAAQMGADPAALAFDNDAPPQRSNQRVAVGALLATGWRPAYPSFREGFARGL